jgi:hypothetical protein
VTGDTSTPEKWPEWAQKFLDSFEEVGTVKAAAAQVGIQRTTPYKLRKRDSSFAQAWEEAEEASTQTLEREALRRAVEGVDKPVTVAGEREVVKVYSDTLLIFMLKARRPDVYRERIEVDDKRAARRREAEKLSDDELDERLVGRLSNVTSIEKARKGKAA